MDKVDILMATYNGEKYIKQQLDSIITQTYNNFSLYILDDMSTDGTYNIIKEYEKKDERIKVFRNDKNIGSTKTFARLLEKVTSDYYMFSDQDDVWYDNKIEKSVEQIKKSGVGLVCTDLEIVDEDLKSLGITFNNKMGKIYKLKKYDDIRLVHLYNTVTGCTIISKKEYIKYILPFPENKNIIHDHYIPLVVSKYAKILYLDEPTIKYRQHLSNQLGTKKYTDKFDNFDEVRKYLIELKISIFETYVQKKDIFDEKFQKTNKEALEYFKMVKEKKNINFQKINVFNKLYRYDSKFYYFWNYFLMNVPILARLGYNIKRKIK